MPPFSLLQRRLIAPCHRLPELRGLCSCCCMCPSTSIHLFIYSPINAAHLSPLTLMALLPSFYQLLDLAFYLAHSIVIYTRTSLADAASHTPATTAAHTSMSSEQHGHMHQPCSTRSPSSGSSGTCSPVSTSTMHPCGQYRCCIDYRQAERCQQCPQR